MKRKSLEISPRYIVDDSGKKTEVILDVSTFEQMLEIVEDAYLGSKAKRAMGEGEFIDFDEANKKISKRCC